jgi:hypothetical protein
LHAQRGEQAKSHHAADYLPSILVKNSFGPNNILPTAKTAAGGTAVSNTTRIRVETRNINGIKVEYLTGSCDIPFFGTFATQKLNLTTSCC